MEHAVHAAAREVSIRIVRESVRLSGIRREPLASWTKDARGRDVPELALNTGLMREAFLQMLAAGLGALILVSATAVVLSGFSTKIKKEDFWYITVIGILQAAKVVGSISGPAARFFVQFPAASMQMKLVVDPTKFEFAGVATIVPVLFATAPVFATVACLTLSTNGLVRVNMYGVSDTDPKRGNVKPALVVFFSLVLAQGALLLIWCLVWLRRSDDTLGFSRRYFGNGNRSGIELVNRYVTQTQDKCIEKGVFSITNRTLVSFAAELLQSEYHSDHVSAVSVLRVLTTREERAAGAVEQICSSEQIVGNLFKLLRPKSPLDVDSRYHTAEILTKLACNLRLTDIPGAAHSISSLLDPHPRLMKTAAQAEAGQQEPPPPLPGQHQVNITNEGVARDCPLIVHGLAILCELANDPGNCTEICKTTDLVPKILAPVAHGLLSTIGNDPKTIQIVKASLHVMAKLTGGTGESSRQLRLELSDSDNGRSSRTAENILWVVRNSRHQEMRILAVEILTRLTLGEPRIMHHFIAELKRLLFDPQESSLRIPAGKALNALAIDRGNCEAFWEQLGNDFPSQLVAAMNAEGNSTEHRAVTAEFLAQICAKSRTDQASTGNRLIVISNALSTVLEAIVTTEIEDMTTERREFLASFLGLAVQIRENHATTEAFANVTTEDFARKLNKIIVEMTKTNESDDETCLVITKTAAKLVTWTMSIDPLYAQYFHQQKIVGELNKIVNAMDDLERCVVLRGDADKMERYETLQTLVEEVRNLLAPLPPLQHDLATDIQNPESENTA